MNGVETPPEPQRSASPPPLRRLLVEPPLWALVLLVPVFYNHVLFRGELFYYRDLSIYYLPLRRMLADAMRAGEWPLLWNPLLHGGVPYAADISTSSFYPGQLLYLLVDPIQGLDWEIALHVGLASAAAYLLGRTLALSPAASTVVAVVYAYCGYSLSRTNLLVGLLGWPWLAVVLLCWHRFLHGGRRLWWVLAVLAGGVQVLAGQPELVALTHGMVLLWTVLIAAPERRWLLLGSWGAWTVGVALLAAVQLVPLLELAAEGTRGRGIALEIWSGWSVAPQRLPELVVPGFFGPVDRFADHWYWGAARMENGFPYMLSIYLGMVTCLLAIPGASSGSPLSRRLRLALAAVAVAAVTLSLGRHLPGYELLYHVPGSALVRFPVKWINAAILPLALLAGAGIDAARRPSSSPGLRLAAWVAGGFTAVLTLFFWAWEGFGEVAARALFLRGDDLVRTGVATALAHAAGSALLLALVWELGRRRGRDIAWPLALIACLDVLAAGWGLNPSGSQQLLDSRPEAVAAVRNTVGDGRLYRAKEVFDSRLMPPTDDLVWRFWLHRELLTNYFAWAWGVPVIGHDDFHGLAPHRSVVYTGTLRVLPWPRRMPMLAAAGVTAIVTREDIPGSRPVATFAELGNVPTRLYEGPRLVPPARFVTRWRPVADTAEAAVEMARGFDPQVSAIIEGAPPPSRCDGPIHALAASEIAPGEWRVKAPCSGYLVLQEQFYPGWQHRVDGRKVAALPADLVSTAIPLEAGNHRVSRRYVPRPLYVGAAISATSLCCLFAFVLAGHRRRSWRKGRA